MIPTIAEQEARSILAAVDRARIVTNESYLGLQGRMSTLVGHVFSLEEENRAFRARIRELEAEIKAND